MRAFSVFGCLTSTSESCHSPGAACHTMWWRQLDYKPGLDNVTNPLFITSTFSPITSSGCQFLALPNRFALQCSSQKKTRSPATSCSPSATSTFATTSIIFLIALHSPHLTPHTISFVILYQLNYIITFTKIPFIPPHIMDNTVLLLQSAKPHPPYLKLFLQGLQQGRTE